MRQWNFLMLTAEDASSIVSRFYVECNKMVCAREVLSPISTTEEKPFRVTKII